MRSLLCFTGLLALVSFNLGCTECTTDSDCKDTQFCQFDTGECEGEGVCMPVGERCAEGVVALEPRVCGCDNQTYNNDCLRRAAKVSKLKEFACEDDGTGGSGGT